MQISLHYSWHLGQCCWRLHGLHDQLGENMCMLFMSLCCTSEQSRKWCGLRDFFWLVIHGSLIGFSLIQEKWKNNMTAYLTSSMSAGTTLSSSPTSCTCSENYLDLNVISTRDLTTLANWYCSWFPPTSDCSCNAFMQEPCAETCNRLYRYLAFNAPGHLWK